MLYLLKGGFYTPGHSDHVSSLEDERLMNSMALAR